MQKWSIDRHGVTSGADFPILKKSYSAESMKETRQSSE